MKYEKKDVKSEKNENPNSVYYTRLVGMEMTKSRDGVMQTKAQFEVLRVLSGVERKELTVLKTGQSPKYVQKGALGLVSIEEQAEPSSHEAEPMGQSGGVPIFGPIWLWILIGNTGPDEIIGPISSSPVPPIEVPVDPHIPTEPIEERPKDPNGDGLGGGHDFDGYPQSRIDFAREACRGQLSCMMIILNGTNPPISGPAEGGPAPDTGDTGLPQDARFLGW